MKINNNQYNIPFQQNVLVVATKGRINEWEAAERVLIAKLIDKNFITTPHRIALEDLPEKIRKEAKDAWLVIDRNTQEGELAGIISRMGTIPGSREPEKQILMEFRDCPEKVVNFIKDFFEHPKDPIVNPTTLADKLKNIIFNMFSSYLTTGNSPGSQAYSMAKSEFVNSSKIEVLKIPTL